MNIIMTGLLWGASIISLYFAVFWFLVLLEDPPQHRRKEIQDNAWPLVSVIIPAYNEEDCVAATMESCLAVEYPHDRIQLIVVNDGSKDRTEQETKRVIARHPDRDIIYIARPNGGKGSALNLALKSATGEFIATMDSDSFVEPGALKIMLPYFTDDSIASVVPSMTVREPKNLLQKVQWYEYVVNIFYKELMGRLDCVHVIPGPFPLYRKGVLLEVGGFDEKRNLTEDLELTLRLQSRNYRIIQLLEPKVSTITPDTWKSFYSQRNRWFKGALLNALNYRWMVFNRKFGDFGYVQLPTIIISGALSLLLVSSFLYYSFKPYVKLGYHLFFVNFDVMTLLKALQFNFSFYDLNFMNIVLMVAMTGISLTMIIVAHRTLKQRVTKTGVTPLLFFLVVYYLLLGWAWVTVARDLMIRRVQQW
jgi:cellulose synthase/poly-beta-1,6-N-acetylglucosamine synthase-like glycosyltransferase